MEWGLRGTLLGAEKFISGPISEHRQAHKMTRCAKWHSTICAFVSQCSPLQSSPSYLFTRMGPVMRCLGHRKRRASIIFHLKWLSEQKRTGPRSKWLHPAGSTSPSGNCKCKDHRLLTSLEPHAGPQGIQQAECYFVFIVLVCQPSSHNVF